MAGGLLELGDSFGDLVDPVAELPDRLGDLQRLLCPFSSAMARPPPELQARQAAWRLSLAKKRSGRWLLGTMWWTEVAWAGAAWPADLADEPVPYQDGSAVFCQALVL